MQGAKQLNLYKRDEVPNIREIEAEEVSDIIDKEVLAKILKEKVAGKELRISMFDGIMMIYNIDSKNKIEPYNPSSLKLFAKALDDLEYSYNKEELGKEITIREELIKKDIIRKHQALKKEKAQQVLPKGDR